MRHQIIVQYRVLRSKVISSEARWLTVALLATLVVLWPGTGPATAGNTKTATLRVDGMVCPVCERTVQTVAMGVEGVISAKADRHTRTLVIVYDPTRVTPEQVAARIDSQTYYRAQPLSEFIKTVTLKIPEMDTREKADRVIRTMKNLDGVAGGTLRTGWLILDYDERKTSPGQLISIIRAKTSLTATVEATPAVSSSQPSAAAKAVIKIEGMTDARTASQVTAALPPEGILDGSVNLDAQTITVLYDASKLSVDQIMQKLQAAVPNRVRLASAQAAGGRSLLSSPWVIVVPGLVVLIVLIWPVLRRRLAPAAGRPI